MPAKAYLCLHKQVLLVDQVGCLHVWDLRRERCAARKRLCRGPIAGIFICSSTLTATAVGITCADRVEFWHIDRQLDYNIVPGGHQGAVIALHCVHGDGSQVSSSSRLSSWLPALKIMWCLGGHHAVPVALHCVHGDGSQVRGSVGLSLGLRAMYKTDI